jgi:hypothetical protein
MVILILCVICGILGFMIGSHLTKKTIRTQLRNEVRAEMTRTPTFAQWLRENDDEESGCDRKPLSKPTLED